MKSSAAFSVIMAGFTAMASQIVLMREFLIVFYGNELSIGFILASWLMGASAGSFLAGRMADRLRSPAPALAVCQSAVAVILPLSILAVRTVKPALGIATGAIVPFFPMAASSFLILLPLCASFGFIFSIVCRIYSAGAAEAAEGIGKVYIMEAAGAIAGGLITSFVLVRLMEPLGIMAFLGVVNLAAAGWTAGASPCSGPRTASLWIVAAVMTAATIMWPLGGWERLHAYSMARLWSGYKLLESRNSIYGNIAVARNAEETTFFENGLQLYTVPDPESREEAAHFALLEHPDPRSVLIVGGGVSGLLDEVAKHPVERIDYVELDPLIIRMAREILSAKYTRILNDKRVSVKNTDGRLFVKTAPRKYDCVIVNVGDPSTAQLNRFYTLEFFGEVRRILEKGGVLSFSVSSSENYINDELAAFLRCINTTAGRVFPDVRVMPGNTAYFLASDGTAPLTCNYKLLMERAGRRNIDTRYVREYYLFSKLSPERVAYVQNVLRTGYGAINRDFRPIAYYYYLIYWMSHFRDSLIKGALEAVTFRRILWAAAVLLFLIFFYGSISRAPSVPAIALMGASSMIFQMVILLSFQMIYGYMFYKLGAILTAFMAGLLLGGALAIRSARSQAVTGRIFPAAVAAISAYAVLLPASLAWLASGRSAFTAWFGPNIMFMLLPMAAGLLGGFQFPLANRLYLAGRLGAGPEPLGKPAGDGLGSGAGRSAGLNYGADLAGAGIGALVTGTVLIPVAGIPATCLITAVANLAAALVLSRRL